MPATQSIYTICSLAVHGITASGVSRADVAKAIGQTPGFVEDVAVGKRRLTLRQMRQLHQRTGRSCEAWALDAMDLSRVPDNTRDACLELKNMVADMDAALAGLDQEKPAVNPARRNRRPSPSKHLRRKHAS